MKLTVTTFVTADGIAQAPGGADEDRDGGFEYGGWFIPHFDEVFGEQIDGWFMQADAFLLGRRTYEIFASHWPKVTDPEDIVAGRLNSLPKYVPTRTLEQAEWENTILLTDDVEAAIAKLKDEPGGELQVHGSLGLIQTLNRARLVDEYRIVVTPVILGAGKRLFDEVTPTGLELVESQATPKGLVVQVYRPAGDPVLMDAPPPDAARDG